jgi:pseudouridine-5'-phosphate glycosidase/pseudouridine kinase
VLDISSKYNQKDPIPATSNYGRIHYSMGGVGRNIAEACFRTGGNPCFITLVGHDIVGEGLIKEMQEIGMVILIRKQNKMIITQQ